MANGIILGQFEFVTKAAARKAIQAVANTAVLGKPLVGSERELVLALLERHRDPGRKIGPGIRDVHVNINSYRKRGFYITRVDGTTDDFSWTQCLTPPRPIDRLRTALRRFVVPQVHAARDQYFGGQEHAACQLTGRAITRVTCHVHHEEPSFAELVELFLANERIAAEEVAFVAAAHVEGAHLTETWKWFGDRFAAFHQERARLLVVHDSEHLRLPR